MSPSALGTAALSGRPGRAVEDQPPQHAAPRSCQARRAHGTQADSISHLPRLRAGNAFALPLLEPQSAEGTQLMRSSPNKRAEHDLFDKDPDLFDQEPRAKIWQGNLETEH